jgi:beta-phosphoglucomutase-like phosphatase (HAD superfamily)
MTNIAPVVTLSPQDYDAVLFDLDGVLTNTASVHADAWKKLFDEFLEQRAAGTGKAFVAFDIDADYRRYVDGKSRHDGVVAFLESRGIALPFGAPEDPPGTQTVHALGNLKDRYFMQHLEQHGVEAYEASLELVRMLRAQEIKTAVVSSSKNCVAVPPGRAPCGAPVPPRPAWAPAHFRSAPHRRWGGVGRDTSVW